MKKGRIILISIVVVVAAVVVFVMMGNKQELQVNTRPVEEGNLDITILATGYIQPVEEVEVGTQVSGVVEEIYVDYNSQVTKGMLLARLDTQTLKEQLNQAKSSMTSAEADFNYANRNYERTLRLHEGNAATDVEKESAINALAQSKTALERAKANLNQAEVNLSYAYIYSPIDGVVLSRAVNTGQTVAASFSTPTLFTIAEDLTKMQVEADVDEADIGQVKLGQSVEFYVDAYYNETFKGVVSQIRLQPETTNNVVTYKVIIDAPNPDEKLFPGMTANITITVETDKGLLVPIEAINFKMSDEMAQELGVSPQPADAKTAQVWVKKNGSYEHRTIEVGGMNDGINMIAKSGVTEGEDLVLSAIYIKKSKKEDATSIMPGPPGGGRR